MLEYAFMAVLAAKILIGAYCAGRLDRSTHWLIRTAFLSPAFAAIYTLTEMAVDRYVAYWPDMLRALAMLAVYWLAARPPMQCGRHILDEKPKEAP